MINPKSNFGSKPESCSEILWIVFLSRIEETKFLKDFLYQNYLCALTLICLNMYFVGSGDMHGSKTALFIVQTFSFSFGVMV